MRKSHLILNYINFKINIIISYIKKNLKEFREKLK